MIVFDHLEKTAFIVSLRPAAAQSDPWTKQMQNTMETIAKQGRDHVPHKSPSSSHSLNVSNFSTIAAGRVSAGGAAVAVSRGDCKSSNAVDDLRFRWRDDRDVYLSLIDSCKRFIADGESYELCLTNQLFVDGIRAHPLSIYLQLRNLNPAPYGAYFMLSDCFLSSSASADSSSALAIVCSSPERFVRVGGGVCESKPIKGTAPRGASVSADELAAQILAKNEKDRSENLMIVDLIRNDLAHVARDGSVTVPKLMAVESYATVHQLVSTVRADMKEGRQHVDVIRALFPPGSMTGAPKIRSCGILNSLEKAERGIYSGCLGFLAIGGSADFNVVIRTSIAKLQLKRATHHATHASASASAGASGALAFASAAPTPSACIERLNSCVCDCSVSLGAGGAIVHLSNAEAEHDEVALKAKASIAAIQQAHQQAVLAAKSCK